MEGEKFMNRKQPFSMILIIPVLMLILGHPSFRAQPYDTDLCITHYDVCAIPDFDNNNVEIKVTAKIKNFSLKTLDTDEIMVGKSGNHDDWDIEMKEIFWVENGRKSGLSFAPKTVQHPYYDMTIPLFEISFKKSLKHDEEATVEFMYTILGEKKETGFPLQRAAEKEHE
jgi:hypothetical protein